MNATERALIDLNRGQQHSECDGFTVERYEQFAKHFGSGIRDVLDVGCNTGRGGTVLKGRNPNLEIVGLDCVPERLERLDRSVYCATLCGFADDINAPSNTFDAIVAGEIIEHIPAIRVFPSLCEFFRVLRLQGRLLITTPNPHYVRNRIQKKSVLLEPSHVSQHTPASLRRKLEDAGFSNVKLYGSGRATRFVGQHSPLFSVYGSYLMIATKW